MSKLIVNNGKYTVDPLYQWDVNRELEIRGLSLPSIPEIHFANDAMERSIVRQATMDDAGIITVKIPNSLLQKHYTITAYICIYEGDTFKSLYSISIPVKARKKPSDYTIENDEEIYSFNALENLVNNTIANYAKVEERYNEVNDKYEETNEKYNDAVASVEESNGKLKTAIAKAEESKKNYDDAANAYADVSEMVNQFVENNGDILETVQNKADKAIVVSATLSASGWSGNTYSFESVYPVATYDIEISLDSTATAVQAEAFNSAQIVGSATTNVVTAFGEVPTVNIPIIIKAVRK
jgi:hypothetical protein